MLLLNLAWAGIAAVGASALVQDTLALNQGDTYHSKARAGVHTLQEWYNKETGLWDTAGWWISANCMTVLGDLAEIDPSLLALATTVFENTLSRAPSHKNGTTLRKMPGSRQQKHIHRDASQDFLNGFYDDEGWWALGWIQAHDLTQNHQYLTAAVDIFEDMAAGWGATCGGLWWDKEHTANAAIANEIFLSIAAHLARRVAGKKSYYKDWAVKQWKWFEASGLINDKKTINDGLDLTSCKNNGETVWSYNQGVILGGLVELSQVLGDASLLSTAHEIASTAMKALSDDHGVLHESCDPHCTGDGTQFKGIFMRNLHRLQKASPQDDIRDFIRRTADSIWNHDRSDRNKFGSSFAGPYFPANASTQSAACDALVAAAAIL